MLSAIIAVPSATRGTLLGGGATPFVTHSSSAANNARKAGGGAVRVARVDARPGARIDPRSAAMLGAGDHVDPDIRWQGGVVPAGRIGVHKRGALLPILGRAVSLDDQRVGRDRVAEREPVFWVEPVLVLGSGASRHSKAVVGEHLAGAGDMAHHTIEDAPAVPVVVHAELEERAQKTPALRDAKGKRVAHAGIVRPRPLGDHRAWCAVAVDALVAQKRDEVAHCGKTDAEHLGAGGFVPQLVNLEWRKEAALRQQPDRLHVGELP